MSYKYFKMTALVIDTELLTFGPFSGTCTYVLTRQSVWGFCDDTSFEQLDI